MKIFLIIALMVLSGCAIDSYENLTFPLKGEQWKPINPEYFNKTEVQRITEGQHHEVF